MIERFLLLMPDGTVGDAGSLEASASILMDKGETIVATVYRFDMNMISHWIIKDNNKLDIAFVRHNHWLPSPELADLFKWGLFKVTRLPSGTVTLTKLGE